MNRLKKFPLWLWMLTKRLYKKPVFLILLLLIPLVVIGYRSSVRESGKVLTIGLAQQAQDPLADRIFRDLCSQDRLLRYEVFDSPEKARDHLTAGKVDMVWVFPENLSQHIEAYAENPTPDNAFITVLERTENVALALARERLSSTMYTEVARRVYLNYLRQEVPEMAQVSDEKLLESYDNTAFSEDLFTFGDDAQTPAQSNFLLSPLRGLLGVIITLCALAGAMHYLQDEKRGTFCWIPPRRRIIPELSCLLVAVLQLSCVALICMALCGLSRKIWLELPVMVLYSLCVAAFAMMLRQLLGSLRALAIALPVLCVLMLVLCPIFLDVAQIRALQLLFPPTYYINAVYNPAYLGYMAIYTAVCGGIWYLTGKYKKS